MLFNAEGFIYEVILKIKWLKGINLTERISCQTIKILPMQFDDKETTRRIVMHHARLVICQHTEEILKLAYK